MTRRFLMLFALTAVLIVGSTAAASAAGESVDASAKFVVTLDTATARFKFGQSPIVESSLGATPQVPVSLHAAPKKDPLKEFVLAGQAKKGSQTTSEDLVVSLSVDVGDQSMLLISDEGDCTVKVKTLTDSRISGSFTCDTTYADQPVKASGTFRGK